VVLRVVAVHAPVATLAHPKAWPAASAKRHNSPNGCHGVSKRGLEEICEAMFQMPIASVLHYRDEAIDAPRGLRSPARVLGR
jgi:hypothetical protein